MNRRHLVLLVLGALVLAACGGDGEGGAAATPGAPAVSDGAPDEQSGGELVGVFGLAAGACADAGVTAGSYFRMVQSGGTVDAGPFVPNGDSPCGDTTFVPLRPGSDGGLITGGYQPFPDPAFDDGGNGTAGSIAEPAVWFAVGFALATNPEDPQTATSVPAPSIAATADGSLTGDLSALSAAWNGQFFNQGSPKPGAPAGENATPVTGTFDAASGAYTLDWSSRIVGGAFDGFTGVWHLEGVFDARSG